MFCFRLGEEPKFKVGGRVPFSFLVEGQLCQSLPSAQWIPFWKKTFTFTIHSKSTTFLILCLSSIMVTTCWVRGCKNRAGINKVSFFRFPRRPENRRKVWIENIIRHQSPSKKADGGDGTAGHKEPTKNDRVCSDHFITGWFFLVYLESSVFFYCGKMGFLVSI